MTRLAIPRFLQHLCFIIALICPLTARMGGVFAADANTPPISGSWLVEDIRGDGVTDLAHFTLTIDNNGQAAGSSGCNRFHGPVKRDGETIGIGPLTATKKMCAPVLMAREQKFFAAIGDVHRFQLTGDTLTLYAKGDAELLKLTRIKGSQPK